MKKRKRLDEDYNWVEPDDNLGYAICASACVVLALYLTIKYGLWMI